MSTTSSAVSSPQSPATRAGRTAGPPDTTLLRIEWPTAEQFRQLLDSFPPDVLARRYLIGGIPHLFRDDPVKYLALRETIARALEIGHHDVGIVGSARIGLLLSGQKGWSHFAMGHDIDVAIVAPELINEGLDALARRVADLPLRQDEGGIDPQDLKEIQRTARNYAAGYLSPDTFPEDDGFRIKVNSALNQVTMQLLALTSVGPVSRLRAKVFRSWQDVESFYTNLLRALARRRSLEEEEE
ncbi:MAG: hypothetical protein RMK29_04360 [Myxococcales bacterium]|nr:hypothetical protein [Myxococcota bacterium]MDW8280921.1 hypothetical protein [Myxococcales bacterium]